MRSSPLRLALLALIGALLACNAPGFAPERTVTPLPPTATLPPETPVPASPTPAPTADTGWELLEPGLELRQLDIPLSAATRLPATLVRVDPALFTFRVHYDPANPSTVSAWQGRTGAVLVINGGFFMTDNRTLGLLVADGQPYGVSFDRHGGMLSVRDGEVDLRSLAQFPYSSEEAFDQAVQGRPMLLYPGGFPTVFDLAPDPSRRTAVATDYAGRLIFVVVELSALTLYDLRDWLAGLDDPELFAALNLDGGGSTGLALAAGGRSLLIESRSSIPSVIAFYPHDLPR